MPTTNCIDPAESWRPRRAFLSPTSTHLLRQERTEDENLDLYERRNLLRYHRTSEETERYLARVRAEMAAADAP